MIAAKYRIVLIFLVCLVQTCIVSAQHRIDSIAFGSCLRQNEPAPIWGSIIAARPDIFIFSGDNIYADTRDEAIMLEKYAQLSQQSGFQTLRSKIPVYATWDDHDYGQNDAGAEFPFKHRSQEIFLDFFQVPENAQSRKRDGVYAVYRFGSDAERVQIILLDTRFFRGPTVQGTTTSRCPRINYVPQQDPNVTVLGDEQWVWLEEQLMQPAQLRIIVSSIQVIPEKHCFEKWANFPHERARLLRLIGKTNSKGIIFVSGDRHLAEISKLLHPSVPYPLYEVTSSGMNSAGTDLNESNHYRITEDNYQQDNFGFISINWKLKDPQISLQIRNVNDNTVFNKTISLSSLHKSFN